MKEIILSQLRSRTILLLHLLIFLAAIYPILSVNTPSLTDYPNHLARAHIMAHYDDTPELQQNYVIEPAVIPSIAMDVIISTLAKHIDIYLAGKIFILLIFFVWVSGTLTLQYTLYKKLSLTSFIVYLVLYNHAFSWGFLNFLLGVGLIPFALSFYIHSKNKSLICKIVGLSLINIAIFFCHFFAALLSLLLVLVYELGKGNSAKEGFKKLLPVLASSVVLLGLFALAPDAGGKDLVFATQWMRAGLLQKFEGVFLAPFNFAENYLLPIFFYAFFIYAFLYLRWIRFHPQMKGVLWAMFGVVVVTPSIFFGTFADIRIPQILILLMAAASTMWVDENEESQTKTKFFHGVCCALLTVSILHYVNISKSLQTCDAAFNEYREATSSLENNGPILVMGELISQLPCGQYSTHWQVPNFAVITKNSYLPDIFKKGFWTQANPKYADIAPEMTNPILWDNLTAITEIKKQVAKAGQVINPKLIYWLNWQKDYAYVVDLHFGIKHKVTPPELVLVKKGSYFSIYKNKKYKKEPLKKK